MLLAVLGGQAPSTGPYGLAADPGGPAGAQYGRAYWPAGPVLWYRQPAA